MALQFPPYFQKTPVALQSPWADVRWKVYNRTGGALVAGGVYMFDVTMSQSETTTFNWMDAASVWRNITTQGTAATGTGTATVPTTYTGFYCVATEAVADNVETEVVVQGEVSVLTVANSALQFLPKFTSLHSVAAQTYINAIPGSGAYQTKSIGRTLVAIDQGSTSVAASRLCLFAGFGMFAA